jgi:hypothetical protein
MKLKKQINLVKEQNKIKKNRNRSWYKKHVGIKTCMHS